MRKLLILTVLAVIVSSCGIFSSTPDLYYWGGKSGKVTKYEDLAYKDYKAQTPEATCSLVCLYEDMVTNPGGDRKMPPPGICAEYGYLLLLPETADAFMKSATSAQRKVFSGTDYTTLFTTKGQEMLRMEIEYYPESRQFIEPLLKKLSE